MGQDTLEKILYKDESYAISGIGDEHRAQVFTYLKATDFQLGLLVNFGHYPKATIERIAFSYRKA